MGRTGKRAVARQLLTMAVSRPLIPFVALEQVLLPCRVVIAQALVVPAWSAKKFMPFQGIDGVVQHIDDGGMTGFGQRLEALRIGPANSDGCCVCHSLIVDEM